MQHGAATQLNGNFLKEQQQKSLLLREAFTKK